MGHFPAGSFGGGGVDTIKSTDSSVTVVDPTGPIVDLTSAGAGLPLIPVLAYGADPTGVADSTAAFTAAQAKAVSIGGGVLYAPGERYLLGTSANVPVFPRLVGLQGSGSSLTTLTYVGAGTCIAVSDAAAWSAKDSVAAPFSGFTVNGIGASAGAVGFSWGDMLRARNSDISVTNFAGAGSMAYYLHNTVGYSEQGIWRGIRAVSNNTAYVFDSNSFDYSDFDLYAGVPANANGWVFQNSAYLTGCRVYLRGNFVTAAISNSGIALQIEPAGAGASYIKNSLVDIGAECNGSGIGHQAFNIDGNAATAGIFAAGSWTMRVGIGFVAGVISGSAKVAFSGYVDVSGLSVMDTINDALVVAGGSQWTEFAPGALVTHGTVYWRNGDFQLFQLNAGATTIAAFGSGAAGGVTAGARRVELFLIQPAGSAGTVVWPAAVKWAAGAAPALSSGVVHASAVDRLRFTYLPSTGFWYGELVGLNYS